MKGKSLLAYCFALFVFVCCLTIKSYSQEDFQCGVPEIKFTEIPTDLYIGETSSFVAKVYSNGLLDQLCAVYYEIYKDGELIENFSDHGTMSFKVRVQDSEYTTVNIEEPSGNVGFQYSVAFFNIDVYAATLGVFDNYCVVRNRPITFTFNVIDPGSYRVKMAIQSCSNAGNSIYSSFAAIADNNSCCETGNHNDKSAGFCENPTTLAEYDLDMDIVAIKILEQPQAAVICGSTPATLVTSAQNYQGTAISYQWYFNNNIIPNAQDSVYQAMEAGAYHCVASYDIYSRQTDVVNVEELELNIPETCFLCRDSIAEINLSGFDSYLWSDGSNLSSYTVTEVGTYGVTVNSGTCQMTGDFVAENAPNYNLVTEGTIVNCETDVYTIEVDTATLHASNIIWNNDSQYAEPYHVAEESGTYYVSAIISSCPYSDTVIVQYLESVPDFSLPDVTFCVGDSLILVPNVPENPNYSYLWNEEEESYNLSVSAPGIYVLQINNDNNCPKTDTMEVFQSLLPQITLQNTRICSGDTISISIEEPQNANYIYVWDNELNSFEIDIFEEGTHNLVVTNEFGCQSEDSLLITEVPIPDVTLHDIFICDGDSISLHPEEPENTEFTYLWNGELGAYEVNLSEEGQYVLMVINENNCYNTDTLNVIAFENPNLNLQENYQFFIENQDTSLTIIAGADYRDYLWSNGDTTNYLTIECGELELPYTAEFVLRATTADGCTVIDTISVFIASTIFVSENQMPSYNIYPNPSSDFIEISGAEFSYYEIFNINGNLLVTSDSKMLDISNLDNAVYFVKIYRDSNVFLNKLIKCSFE